ncbi:DNA replication/repair protein RecF [Peptococcaceae bacterium 1198_IL3148]
MKILKIRAEMFRNYNNFEITPSPGLNIITGQNAQGKTNLLEAIYFNLNGFSFRAAKDKELINWQSDYSNVIAIINNNQHQWKQTVAINDSGQKKFFINGVEKKKKELGHSGVVLFTPDDLALVKSSPQIRRKFLDQEIGPFTPGYIYHIQQYNKVISHRNRLLKSIRFKKESLDMLELWNQQLVELGTRVLLDRLAILKKMAPHIIKWYRVMTNGKENLEIRYLSSLKIEPPLDEIQIKNKFYQLLRNTRSEEVNKCQTLFGPHRDDIVFFINGKDARNYGSQGQQRTVVLSLKMAQVSLWAEEQHTEPILLLDDVLFELDRFRQEMLLSKVQQGIQTFITTSQLATNINLASDYKVYQVSDGVIST